MDFTTSDAEGHYEAVSHYHFSRKDAKTQRIFPLLRMPKHISRKHLTIFFHAKTQRRKGYAKHFALIFIAQSRSLYSPSYSLTLSLSYTSHAVLHVLMPTIAYNGQKLTRLVRTKTPPRTSRTKPSVPVTVPVKYRTANTAASRTRMILSAELIFFFIANRNLTG